MKLRNNQMAEMHKARYEMSVARSSHALCGRSSFPACQCIYNPEALPISLFKSFYNPISSPSLPDSKTVEWAEISNTLITWFFL